MMNNDPEDDPALFAGKTRLWYGRWDYKYEQAARHGAAGAIIIHTMPSAGYKWQVLQTSWTGEQFALPSEGEPEVTVKGWATEDASRRSGHARRARTSTRCARPRRSRTSGPVPLGVTLVDRARERRSRASRPRTSSAGCPAAIPRCAPQAVLYTAHHDHLGHATRTRKPGEDAIYNGALDNASGVAAMLAIAKAMAALPQRPRRSVLFAAVAAEEQGLLGSKYLAAHPPMPAGRIAANINIDGMNIWGRTRDLTMIGLGKSDLDDWILGLAAVQGRTRGARPVPGQGLLLPLRPVLPGPHRRARRVLRRRHRRHRQAGGLGQGAAGGVRGQGLPPGRRTSCARTGTSRARWRTRSSASTSG